jgi:hypothetical protein
MGLWLSWLSSSSRTSGAGLDKTLLVPLISYPFLTLHIKVLALPAASLEQLK